MRDTAGNRIRTGLPGLIACAVWLLAALPAHAMTAYESFQDGNRLFRDDLYWAALLRYRQAAEAGMDTPLLHYNTGVAHYRAGQHIRARASLLKAAQDPELRVLAQYNLGLNAYAAGNTDEALDWFRQARDQEENRRVRRLAITAISRIRESRRAEDPVVVREVQQREERKIGEFSISAMVGFGADDNVYRSPKYPYVDQSDPAQPVVVPEEQSGAFIPVDLVARYDVNSYKFESFFGEYRLQGRFYQDKELDTANEYSQELRFGSEFDRRQETRSTRVYSAFSVAQHDETYYDPDDGLPLEFGGEPIDERFNYVRYGPEFSVRRSHSRLSYGLRFKGQQWDYTDTEVVPEYDHEYFLAGANIQFRFTETSLLRFTVEKESRVYGDRPSYDLDGQQPVTNPTVRYDYLELGLLARQRITRNMWFGFGYEYSEREDRYLGYNNYTRDHYYFEYHWSPGRRFELDFRGYYRLYDFPNAFAYNNPAAETKTLETARSHLALTYRMTPHLSLRGELQYRGATSSDARIGFEQYLYSLGVVWQQ